MYSVLLFVLSAISINALPFKMRRKDEEELGYLTANEVSKVKEELVWGSETSIDNNNGVTTAKSSVKIEHSGFYYVMIQNEMTGGDWVVIGSVEEAVLRYPGMVAFEYEVQHFWSEKCMIIGEYKGKDGLHEVRTSEWNLRKTVVIILCVSIGVVLLCLCCGIAGCCYWRKQKARRKRERAACPTMQPVVVMPANQTTQMM